jgi:hypothetical protein
MEPRLLQILLVAHLLKTFPKFYGTKLYLPFSQKTLPPFVPILSQINPVHILPIISFMPVLILFSHVRLGHPSYSLSFRSFTENLYTIIFLSHACYMFCKSHHSWVDHPNNIWREVHIMNYSLRSLLQRPLTSSLSGPNIPLSAMFSNVTSLNSHFQIFEVF